MRVLYGILHRTKPYAPYVLFVFMIMAPLFAPGYIFALDMVFAPVMPLPTDVTPDYIPQALLHYASLIIPSVLVQKLLLAGTLLAAAIGAHRMAAQMRPIAAPAWPVLAPYAAGLLYMVNPFVYSRFMAGQYFVLLGYALLPFFVLAWWRLLQTPALGRAAAVAALSVVIASVSLHTAGLALLAAVIMAAGAVLAKYRDRSWLRRTGGYAVCIVIAVAVASSYWLIPFINGHGRAATVASFTAADRQAFATDDSYLGRGVNVAALQGFWADAQSLYLIPQDIFAWWWVPVCLLWVVVIGGIVWSWRYARTITVMWLSIVVVAGMLAAWMRLDAWLALHVPLFAGYREPQKFVALIALAYAYFAAAGLAGMQACLARSGRYRPYAQAVGVGVLSIPLLCAPLMIGFHGQLRPSPYPQGWYDAQTIVSRNPDAAVLVLPWHAYMRFSFTHAVVAHPAAKFFAGQAVVNPDPEFNGAAGYIQTATQQRVGRLLAMQTPPANSNAVLSESGIRYVLVTKELDYRRYDMFIAQAQLRVVLDTSSVTLYEVRQ
jgi:hypothetical protein